MTLRQTCLNAIERFSPSVLQNRSMQSCGHWGIPEAAFQDEMYCSLNYELHNLPVLSEYSHTKDGRVDFYIFDKKWGIEVLQCGSKTEIAKHAARFAPGGKYREWNIFEDYIILNFCSKSTVRKLEIEGNVFPVIRDCLVLIVYFLIRCRTPVPRSTSCCGSKRVHRGGIQVRRTATSNVELGRRKTKVRRRRVRLTL